MLSQFDPAVRDAISKSPTLQSQLEQLERDGWTIRKGTPGGGSVTNNQTKTITIDPNDSVNQQISGISHEIGHAEYLAERQ
jgi:hypothetical protein